MLKALLRIPKKFLIIGGALFALTQPLGMLGLVNYTTSYPGYCVSCHATGETADMSKASLVHPGYDKVGCVQCHAKPGQVIFYEGYKDGFEANPVQTSVNCANCHKKIITNEQENYKHNPLAIRIPHKLHVESMKVTCAECHSNIAHDLREKPTNRPQMEACYQCHARNTACNKCHTAAVPQGVVQKY